MVTREIAVERFKTVGVNFDTLTKEICDLLTKFNHINTTEGVEKMLLEFADNKWELMQMIKKHPNYNNNLQIITKANFAYRIDRREINNALTRFLNDINARDKIVTTTNERGETFYEALHRIASETPKAINYKDYETLNIIKDFANLLFDRRGEYQPSINKYNDLVDVFNLFYDYDATTVTSWLAERLNKQLPKIVEDDGTVISHGIKAAEGMKTSRAFNKVFAMFGLDKDPDYLKVFPAYSDLLKDGMIEREIVISLNPIDYLTMSFGNTWASCHTIDRGNIRNRPNSYSGGYCAGTQSYMLDDCTMVVYAPTPYSNGKPETADKILRNMIMYKNGMLLQSRIYPQTNDGVIDLFDEFRHLEQKAICECLGIEYVSNGSGGNDTWIKKGSSSSNDGLYETKGLHYPDYTYSSMGGNISYIRGTELQYPHMHIGHRNICPKCGTYHTNAANRLACDDCCW